MDLPARSASLWIAVVAGMWVFGCARTVVPPPASLPSPASIPTPAPVTTPEVTDQKVPHPWSPPTISAPVSKSNPWKPLAKARSWKFIVLHHTASEQDTVESIHEVHLKKKDKKGNPWLGIGYHFVIGNGRGMGDGEIEPTFRWKTQIQGAHAGSANREYNDVGIGICLVGNFENSPPSTKQLAAIKRLVKTLKSDYKIATANVVKHSDVRDGGTECPGKYFPMDEVAAGERNLVDATDGQPLRLAVLPGSSP
jgi:hypothetical protein